MTVCEQPVLIQVFHRRQTHSGRAWTVSSQTCMVASVRVARVRRSGNGVAGALARSTRTQLLQMSCLRGERKSTLTTYSALCLDSRTTLFATNISTGMRVRLCVFNPYRLRQCVLVSFTDLHCSVVVCCSGAVPMRTACCGSICPRIWDWRVWISRQLFFKPYKMGTMRR